MTTLEFLKSTDTDRYGVRPRAICKDGFSISIQCSNRHCCWPKPTDIHSVANNLETVELGWPNTGGKELDSINQYFDAGVYLYVPIELVEKLIQTHGGILGAIKR